MLADTTAKPVRLLEFRDRASGSGEILLSSTVKDLVAGSGIVFDVRGTLHLRGVPAARHLYRAINS